MRALHDKLVLPRTDEQRTQWNAAKSELDALDERIAREEELRRRGSGLYPRKQAEQRQRRIVIQQIQAQANERRAAAFNAFCAVVLVR